LYKSIWKYGVIAFLLLWGLVLALMGAEFASLNEGVMSVEFGFWSVEARSIAFVISLTFLVGVFVGVLASIPMYLNKSLKIQRLTRKLKAKDSQ